MTLKLDSRERLFKLRKTIGQTLFSPSAYPAIVSLGGGGGCGSLNSTRSQTPRQGTDPVGKVKAPPSLSSWQMKEPKQSSPALSNAPGTPLPDPPTAEADRDERQAGLGSQSRAPKPTTQLHPEGASQGRPALGPLPHSLRLQLCGGLANGKRKLGQRKRRRAPRLKIPDKRRAGLPPPLPGRPGPGTTTSCVAPGSVAPGPSGPLRGASLQALA